MFGFRVDAGRWFVQQQNAEPAQNDSVSNRGLRSYWSRVGKGLVFQSEGRVP
jgi:hypothetical protein